MELYDNKLRFLGRAKISVPEFDEDLISKAWDFAFRAHGDQKRDTGEPYFAHPVSVANILLDLKCDSSTIAAALLHDVVEDTDITVSILKDEFNADVSSLVDGVSKLVYLDKPPDEAWHKERKRRENLRKLFLSITKDPRVAVIKLGDRQHNLSSLGALPEDRRKRIAQESLEVFAPLAEALGLGIIQKRIQDLAFRYLYPKIYHEIETKIKERNRDFQETQKAAINLIEEELQRAKINALVYGRQKEIYSIYRKMQTMSLEFEQVYDIIGIRIIVDNDEDCYRAKHVVDQLGIEVKYDDYIVRPRGPLGYQSLHKVIEDIPGGQLFEIQIRSKEMNERAERGPAAHWIYKLGKGKRLDDRTIKQINKLRTDLQDKFNILGEMLEDQYNEIVQLENLGEEIGGELSSDRISVITPNGDVISLPSKATPLDFAYHIHTDLGHECVGALVNNHSVPLDYDLKDGDTVEIIRKKGSFPKPYWIIEGKVKTTRAKQKIRNYFKKQEKPKAISYGRDVLNKLMNRLSVFNVNLDQLVNYFGESCFWEDKAPEELYLAVADGRIGVERIEKVSGKMVIERQLSISGVGKNLMGEVIDWLASNKHSSITREDDLALALIRKEVPIDLFSTAIKAVREKHAGQDIVVPIETRDQKDEIAQGLLAKTAQCCYPVPGDEIKGYVTIGSGISIHHASCANILSIRNKDRIIPLEWTSLGFEKNSLFSGELTIVLAGIDAETLKTIQELIRKKQGVLRQLNTMGTSRKGLSIIRLVVDVVDVNQLASIKTELRKVDTIIEVRRGIEA